MRTKILIPIIIALSVSMKSYAQDFHLTQYDAFSLYLNPALTGAYLGDDWSYKIHTIYRTQWKTIPNKPYQTYGLGFDKPYKRVGVGGYLLNNRSGSADFNTLNFQLSGAYFITDPETSPHVLNVGAQAGLFYKSFNYNKLLFENQYDNETGQLNSSMSSGESFNKTSRVNFDANVGVFYKYKDWRSKLNPFLGFSIFHVNMPMENFAGNDKRLPMKFNLNGGVDIRLNNIWKVVPMALYMNQAQADELNVGMLAYYTLNRKEGHELIVGFNHRAKDASMVQLGMKYNNYILRMSYDINTSYLKSYSRRRGGYEITLQICGKKPKHITGAYF
jgi:type IX secretion system PorP/SprF family membrane protein